MAGQAQGGQEHALAGQQQRGHQPVQPPVVRMPGSQGGQHHRLDRRQHQDAGQVFQPERGQHAGHEQARQQRRQRRQAPIDQGADPARQDAVAAVGGEPIGFVGLGRTVRGVLGPGRGSAGRGGRPGYLPGQQVSRRQHAPAEQDQEGQPRPEEDRGQRDHRVAFAGREGDGLLHGAQHGPGEQVPRRPGGVLVAELG